MFYFIIFSNYYHFILFYLILCFLFFFFYFLHFFSVLFYYILIYFRFLILFILFSFWIYFWFYFMSVFYFVYFILFNSIYFILFYLLLYHPLVSSFCWWIVAFTKKRNGIIDMCLYYLYLILNYFNLFAFIYIFYFIYFFIFIWFHLFYSILFNLISYHPLVVFLLLMNCGMYTNRKWIYEHMSILPFIFVSFSWTHVEVRCIFYRLKWLLYLFNLISFYSI